MTSRRGAALLVPVALLTGSLVLLLAGLNHPDDIVFDETYYVEDARSLLAQGVEGGFAVHPPLGKWFIAAGIAVLGDTPAGWRVAGALAGVLTVLLTYLLVEALTGRPALAGVAGLLLALDGVFLVQARTAMLDAFLPPLIVGAVLLLVRDRQVVLAARAAHVLRWRPWTAGLLLGAAIAVKWSAGLALVGAVLLLISTEVARGRRRGRGHPASAAVGLALATGALVVLPAATYAVTWAPWLTNYAASWAGQQDCPDGLDAPCPVGLGDRTARLVHFHEEILRFHLDLDAEHPYRAPATTWPVQTRPVVYHWDSCPEGGRDDGEPCTVPEGTAQEIVALGNVALWWLALPLLPALAAGAVQRDRRSGVVLLFLGVQYLPWLMVARPVFSFYAVPLVPFLAAGVAVAAASLDEPRRKLATWLGGLFGAVVGAANGWVVVTLTGASITGSLVLGATGGALVGGAAGGLVDRVRDGSLLDPAPPALARPIGSLVAALVVALAVAFFLWFAPLWFGVTLPADSLRRRWWLASWI